MFNVNPCVMLLGVVALASTVMAQNIYIALPKANADVVAGSNITVQLDKPMTLTGSQEVSVVIGAFPCSSTSTCPGASEVLGNILYSGLYKPELSSDNWNPYENLTVTIPPQYRGAVQLGVAHFFLLGAGLSAQLQLTNTTINVIPSN